MSSAAIWIPVALLLGVLIRLALPRVRSSRAHQRVGTEPPARAGEAAPTRREQLCPQCGALNRGAGIETCFTCGGVMPVDSFLEVLRAHPLREGLLRESKEAVVLLGVVVLALAFASWMPLAWKVVVTVAAIAFLAFRFLRSIEDA